MSGTTALDGFLQSGTALEAFRQAELIGSPLDALELGRPANAPDDSEQVDPNAYAGDLTRMHTRLVRWFEESEQSTAKARELSERDRDYTDNYNDSQWSDAEKATLEQRGQPITTTNYVRRKVELLSGLERKSRTDPVAYPRTPTEEQRAQVATQVLRYVADSTNLQEVRSAVYRNIMVEGYGAAEITLVDDGKGGADIEIEHIEWDRLWFDPHSRKIDFTDARYLGTVVWSDVDDLEEMYPDALDVIENTFSPDFGSYRDKPGYMMWSDNARKRARRVQCHWQEKGQWWVATYTRAGFLAEPQKSLFMDARARSACPLIMVSAYIDRENNRFGMVRDLISQQDAINKRDSKSLHLLSVNRVEMTAGAHKDVDALRKEVAKPDGIVEWEFPEGGKITTGAELAVGHFQMLQHAISEMQASGPNAAMSGNDPRQQSGRAIIAQQAGGAAANEPLTDALRSWSRRIFEMTWTSVRQFWTGERWVRVTDDMQTVQFVGLNRQVTLQDELAAMPQNQRAAAMQQMQLVPNDPRLMQVMRVENNVSDLEVDITIEEGPDVPAMEAEQFQALSQLVPAMPPPMQLPAWKILLMSSKLKDKAKLLEMMDEAEKAMAQQAQQAQPLMQAEQMAEIHLKESGALLNEHKARESMNSGIKKIAETEKMVSESYAIPVGPTDHPNQMPKPPAGAASK